MLNIRTETQENLVLLHLEGRLDTATSPQFDLAVQPHTQGATRLLIDLAQVNYVSSAGLRVFLMTAKKLQKTGGSLVICAMSPAVREVFDIAGFSRMLRIEADQAAGRAALE
jgi:anti-anti-sigma factor